MIHIEHCKVLKRQMCVDNVRNWENVLSGFGDFSVASAKCFCGSRRQVLLFN